MFSGCSSLTSLDISNFNTINVTDMSSMFSEVPDNAQVYVKNAIVQNWILTSDNNRPASWTVDNVIIKV